MNLKTKGRLSINQITILYQVKCISKSILWWTENTIPLVTNWNKDSPENVSFSTTFIKDSTAFKEATIRFSKVFSSMKLWISSKLDPMSFKQNYKMLRLNINGVNK